MTKGFHKKPSKRIPTKRRYKIEKKVREHNRKLRKELKKKQYKNKHKDPGIPNSLPFKEKILNELQEHKKRVEEIKEVMKIQMKRNCEKFKTNNHNLDFETMLKNAEKRASDFENKTQLDEYLVRDETCHSNTKSFYKDVQKVIESSDIIIQVVDARDPLGTRCFEIENIISKNYQDKKIILLINKCDLIPKENLTKWLNYLRNFFITIPFKACTQNQKKNLSTSKVNILLSSEELLKSSKCLGIDFLMKVLNNYCHNKDVKTSITVGIVGFPNVGKSSVINSLKRTYVCNVGPTPGLTRTMQMVSLDKKIKLIDSPGIVFAKNALHDHNNPSILALRNAINIDKLEDPILPVQAILNRVNPKNLIKIYDLTDFCTVQEFLSLVSKRFGKISKGGRLDLDAAAKKVLHDWNCGKLKYYTLPPERMDSTIDIKFVEQMSKEFNLNNMTYDEMMVDLDQFSSTDNQDAFLLKSCATEIQMDDFSDEQSPGNSSMINEKLSKHQDDNEDVEMKELAGMQLNKNKKAQFKKNKKQRKRDSKLSNQLEQINIQEDYDFDTYF